jgi:hypothetical protein
VPSERDLLTPHQIGETVTTVLEDVEEDEAFEAKLISDYDPRTKWLLLVGPARSVLSRHASG